MPALSEKPAAFWTKARLLFKKADGLLKFAARAFLKSRRAFQGMDTSRHISVPI